MFLQIALSAATPAYRGYLSDLDTRCTAMIQALDDRTQEERCLAVGEIHVLGYWDEHFHNVVWHKFHIQYCTLFKE